MANDLELSRSLRRWANARVRRNGPNGHGKTGTNLLFKAADMLEEMYEDLVAAEKRALAAEERLTRLRIDMATVRGALERGNIRQAEIWAGVDWKTRAEDAQARREQLATKLGEAENEIEALERRLAPYEAQKQDVTIHPGTYERGRCSAWDQMDWQNREDAREAEQGD